MKNLAEIFVTTSAGDPECNGTPGFQSTKRAHTLPVSLTTHIRSKGLTRVWPLGRSLEPLPLFLKLNCTFPTDIYTVSERATPGCSYKTRHEITFQKLEFTLYASLR